MTAKIVKNSISDYHKKDTYISKSILGDILDCPFVYHYWHVLNNPKPETDTLNIGNAVHTLAIEPDEFRARYAVLPEGMRRIGAKWEEFLAANEGKTCLPFNDFHDVQLMAKALAADKTAQVLLKRRGVIENSIYWQEEFTDEETGEVTVLKFKTRPDFLSQDDTELAVDLKTAADITPFGFMKAVENFKYSLSVAMTNRGYQALTGKPLQNYIFLPVSKSEPHMVSAFDAFRTNDSSAQSCLDAGNELFDKAIKLLLKCTKENHWPGYQEGIQPLQIPLWAKK